MLPNKTLKVTKYLEYKYFRAFFKFVRFEVSVSELCLWLQLQQEVALMQEIKSTLDSMCQYLMFQFNIYCNNHCYSKLC